MAPRIVKSRKAMKRHNTQKMTKAKSKTNPRDRPSVSVSLLDDKYKTLSPERLKAAAISYFHRDRPLQYFDPEIVRRFNALPQHHQRTWNISTFNIKNPPWPSNSVPDDSETDESSPASNSRGDESSPASNSTGNGSSPASDCCASAGSSPASPVSGTNVPAWVVSEDLPANGSATGLVLLFCKDIGVYKRCFLSDNLSYAVVEVDSKAIPTVCAIVRAMLLSFLPKNPEHDRGAFAPKAWSCNDPQNATCLEITMRAVGVREELCVVGRDRKVSEDSLIHTFFTNVMWESPRFRREWYSFLQVNMDTEKPGALERMEWLKRNMPART